MTDARKGPPPAGETDQVLLTCTAELYANALIASRGLLTITEAGLEFTTASIKLLNTKVRHLEVPVAIIESAEIVGVRRRLSVTTRDGQNYIFGGTMIRRAFMVLISLLEDSEGLLESQDLMLPAWKAHFHQGPLASPGEISINPRTFRFIPSGALDALAGTVDLITIQMSHVIEARTKGRLNKRFVITTEQDDYVFSMANLEQRCDDFTHQLVYAYGESEPRVSVGGKVKNLEFAKNALKTWREQNAEEEILLFGPAVYVSKRQIMRRGWICLTDNFAFFLPLLKLEDGPKPLVLPTLQLRPSVGVDPDSGELLIEVAGTTLHFLPRGGDAFANEFWRQWNLIPEIHARVQEEKKPARPLSGEEINRRESFRIDVSKLESLTFSVLVLPSRPEETRRRLESKIVDLSVAGLSFLSKERLVAETEVEINLEIADKKVSCIGMVANVSSKMGSEEFRTGVVLPELLVFDEANLRAIVMKCQQFEMIRRKNEKAQAKSSAE